MNKFILGELRSPWGPDESTRLGEFRSPRVLA